MLFVNKENSELPVKVSDFLNSGEYDQNDTALVSYDDLYDYRNSELRLLIQEILEKKEWHGLRWSVSVEDILSIMKARGL